MIAVDDVVIDHAAGMPSYLDALILVDSADRDVGRLSKARCHEGNGILHRAFSLLIFDGNGDLLIQQRAPGKRLWPLYWSNSCCSHPRSGETMEEATQRRLHEELGISCQIAFNGSVSLFLVAGVAGNYEVADSIATAICGSNDVIFCQLGVVTCSVAIDTFMIKFFE